MWPLMGLRRLKISDPLRAGSLRPGVVFCPVFRSHAFVVMSDRRLESYGASAAASWLVALGLPKQTNLLL